MTANISAKTSATNATTGDFATTVDGVVIDDPAGVRTASHQISARDAHAQ